MSTGDATLHPADARYWFSVVSTAAPNVPLPYRSAIARMLADSRTSSDLLLVLADALTEAAEVSVFERQADVAIELHRLAEASRRQARAHSSGEV